MVNLDIGEEEKTRINEMLTKFYDESKTVGEMLGRVVECNEDIKTKVIMGYLVGSALTSQQIMNNIANIATADGGEK